MILLTIDTFCKDLSPILKMIGDVLTIFKLFIPLILITLCIFDIGAAVISNKPAKVKEKIINCVKKLAFSVLIFFIPLVCMVIFGFVDRFRLTIENSGIDYEVCYTCMFDPNDNVCVAAVECAK